MPHLCKFSIAHQGRKGHKGVRGVCPEKLSARQRSAGVVFRKAKQAELVLARPTGATG